MRIHLQNAWTYSELVFLYKTKDVNFNFTQNYKKNKFCLFLKQLNTNIHIYILFCFEKGKLVLIQYTQRLWLKQCCMKLPFTLISFDTVLPLTEIPSLSLVYPYSNPFPTKSKLFKSWHLSAPSFHVKTI